MATSSNRRRRRGGRGRRAAQQKSLTTDTTVIEKALRSLCQNGGQCSLDDLAKIVGKFDPGLGSLEDIISDFQDVHFNIIDNADSSVTVEAYTAAQICPSYLRTDCTEGDGCQNLHMCGYFATGSCCWFGQNCRKCHHFRSDHNKRVLNLFNISFLSLQQLKALFRLAWPQFTVPDFCGPYRSKQGCYKHSCRFLHLCKNYVMGKCRYRTRCKFPHDVYTEVSNLRVLKRFKISLDYSSDDLIRLIKERHEGLYRPEVEVLESYGEESYGEESYGEESDGDPSGGDPSCSSYFYEAGVVGTHDMLENVLLAVSSTENRPDAAATSPSETKCILAKKMEVHPANLLLSRKQEPKPAKQKSSVSGGLGGIAQQGAKSQTPSKQFLDSNIPNTRAVQEKKCILTKKMEEHPAILLSKKQEPKPEKQTPSVSGGLGGMAQHGAKSQTPSKRFLGSNIPRTRAMQEKMEEICKDNLQGMCTSGQLCQRHHCDLPYQWQVLNNRRWESVDSYRNNAMEKKFCDVNNVATCLDFDTWGSMELYYDAMLIGNTENLLFINIRRLEVKGEPHISDAYLISPWSWYWKDEYGTWIEYAEQNTKQNASADKESSDFESLYDAYKNKNGESTVKFMAGNQQYTLDFFNMTQANDHYRTMKDVRRRPSKYITSGDVKRYREEKPWLSNNKYPRTWDMSIRTKSHRLVNVSKLGDSVEYKKIKGLFETTLPGGKITKLERVQNEVCWDAFSRQKEAMMKKNLFRPVDERLLFHGTTQEKVEDISRDNFDFRLSGTRVGAVYGQGAYFASTSKYSDNYAQASSNELKRMFVARVLVGSYTVGNEDMRRPPFKNPTDKKKGMYDSCVNDTSNPSIFVVFDNNQVYPEYLITYSTSSANQTSSYSSSSQYFSSPHNPSSQLTRSASSASRTSYSSSNQHFSHPLNPSTSQPTRSVSSANQTSYSSSNQHFSHPQNPSTSPSTRSASSANHTPYSSSTSTRQSPTLSSSRSSRDSKCICM